jgi:hypothetical protein
MLIEEHAGQLRRLHWRSASQLHRRSTCANSTTKYCIDRSKRPNFYRLFAGPRAPFYSLFVALAILAFIRPCSACDIEDLPQSSYSFSGCYSGCTTNYKLIKLDSAQCWSTLQVCYAARITIAMAFPASRICMHLVFVFTLVVQKDGSDQWVVADLGEISTVCGVTTQGRGESKRNHLLLHASKLERVFPGIVPIEQYLSCLLAFLDCVINASLQLIAAMGCNMLQIMKSRPLLTALLTLPW